MRVPVPSDEKVIEGLKSGCAFQWVIDYIADYKEKHEVRMEKTVTFLDSFFNGI